jgi:DNA-binding transcriptional regulator LsrR (DeoR family)
MPKFSARRSKGRQQGEIRVAGTDETARPQELDPEERESLVCHLFCLGKSVKEIIEVLGGRVHLTREQPYAIVRLAARKGRLRYSPPLESELALRIIEDHRLQKVRVVNSVAPADVADGASNLLVDMVRKWDQEDLHIGFAGGGLLQETVRRMAETLRKPGPAPKRIFFHALIAAAHDPSSSPNAFLHWFLDSKFAFETHFVGLPAPGMVSTSTLKRLKRIEGIRDAFERAGEIDIVVSSAGAHWGDGCSSLYKLFKERASPEVMKELDKLQVVGDILWQPISLLSGPVGVETGVRAVTLLDLADLAPMIARGGRVVLALAPCGACGNSKSEVLGAALTWPNRMFTHLVADTRTASGLYLK